MPFVATKQGSSEKKAVSTPASAILSSPLSSDEFVGRRDELDSLRAQLQLASETRARFVLVEGEIGIGKSRLVAEFLASVQDQASSAVGTCSGAGSPCEPFASILERLDHRHAFAHTNATTHVPIDKASFFASVVNAIERESGRKPLVLAIEDVHVADPATLELLRFLLQRLRTPGALVLVILRSDHARWDPVLADFRSTASRSGFSTLALGGMRRNEIRRLVQQTLRARDLHIDPATLGRIEELAEGNPLFAEELARIAVENGVLDLHVRVPLSVQAILAERLAPFHPGEREVLARAALVGGRFDVSLLSTIAEHSIGSTTALLQRAVDSGLMREDQTNPERFRFRHALIRQALADQVIHALAAPLHARIAQVLEVRPDSTERPAELAYHWSAARNPDKARRWNEAAAEAATKARAYRDAIRFYSAALEWSYPAGASRALIYERLGTLLYIDGCGDEAAGWFVRARAERESLGERDGAANALLQFADQAWVDARTSEALQVAGQAAGDLERVGDASMHARAVLTAARFATTLGEPEQALARLVTVEQALRRLDGATRAAWHEVRGEALALLGRKRAALQNLRAASLLAAYTADSELISQIENNFALAAVDLGELALAQERHLVAVEEARRTGMMWRVAYSALNYAWTLTLAGQLQQARSLVWEALETGVSTATLKTKAACVGIWVGLLLEDRGLLTACADPRALEFAERSGETQRVGSVAAALAELKEGQGLQAEAVEVLQHARKHVRRAHRCWPFFLSIARLGSADDLSSARGFLASSTARPRVTRAYRLLFEALAAHRNGSPASARLAAAAAVAMSCVGHRFYEAIAMELAGREDEALRRYRAIGDARDTKRLRTGREKPRALVLTARQAQIAALVAKGQTNRAIATGLHISEHTVEHHISQIFARLNLKTRAQLAGYWPKAATP